MATGSTTASTTGSGRTTVYSHSRLASFENCPRQFHYRYVERRQVDTEGIEAFLGKRVHEVLERLNHFVARGLVPSLAKVLERFRAEWDRHFDPARVRIVRAENPPEVYRENGERCLANHYRRHYPFDRDETLGIEAHLAFPLDPEGRYRIQGFVDRLARAPDGAIEIHDYKTGRWVPAQERLDADRQLALYQIGVQARHGPDTPVRLVWHYLLRDQVRVSTRTSEQLEALREETVALIDRIEAERDFDPRPGALCTWCEHNDVCPAMQGRVAAAVPGAAADAAAFAGGAGDAATAAAGDAEEAAPGAAAGGAPASAADAAEAREPAAARPETRAPAAAPAEPSAPSTPSVPRAPVAPGAPGAAARTRRPPPRASEPRGREAPRVPAQLSLL
ncbi:MAG TPA: PD-(D/E)XK nuclease family protein [Myxococcota bacterium]